MDRTRRRSGVLTGVAALALSLGAVRADTVPVTSLRAARWLAPGVDVARTLSRRPAECLRRPADPEAAYLVEVGRAAFRDPLLLGGQAARAGVACETCHRNGHTNPAFFFPGVSGAPGTADVTSFVFSSHRGDHIDDPRPIPDLGGPKALLKVSQAPGSPALKTFIRGLVTEEFDGARPPDAVLQGLAAYVRALNPVACATATSEPVTAGAAIGDVRRAIRAGLGALRRRDAETAAVMIQAARAQLGDLAERYVGPDLAAERGGVILAARRLGDIAAEFRRLAPSASSHLAAWLARSDVWAAPILRAEPRSLFDPNRLVVALKSPP